MKKNALSLALIMIAGSMAGCLADGADGVPEITLSDEDVIAIFDDNFADFVNNSSVTVINEIHYHNNTTTSVVNQNTDTSTSEISLEGSGGSGMLHVLDIEFEFEDLVNLDEKPDHRSRTFTVSHTYYDYALNQDVTSDFTVSCGDYYLIGGATGAVTTWWDNNDNYWDAWDQAGYNDTYSQILWDNGYSKWDYCDEDRWLGLHNGYVTEYIELHTLVVPSGYAVKCAFGDNNDGWPMTQSRMLTSTDDGETWAVGYPSITMEESGSGYGHNCDYTYGNGTAMDYTISVRQFAPDISYRLVFYYELVPVIVIGSEVTYGEWINDVGIDSETWSLSLSDDEWLEVKSATAIKVSIGNPDNVWAGGMDICSDSGYIVGIGYADTFGGNFTNGIVENSISPNGDTCSMSPDYLVQSWSIIYKIHKV